MSDPQTTNVLLAVPSHGSDVNSWDVPLNADFTACDGFFGGIQSIALAASPVTLTSPTGTPTPGAGPTQAQNAVLRLSGTLTANVLVTLPLPGYIIVENLTTGNFLVTLRAAGSGELIGIDQGEVQHVYNDGTNVRFVNLGSRIGEVSIWSGLNAMPGWVLQCTKQPYLLCNGTIYNFSDFPYLGKRLGGTFGGNGITTFAVPDLRGRLPLPYDGTGSRITSAVCGINGQTLGASADNQGVILSAAQIPSLTSSATQDIIINNTNVSGFPLIPIAAGGSGPISQTQALGALGQGQVPYATNSANTSIGVWSGTTSLKGSNTINVTSSNTGGQTHSNVQPSLVTGIAVIRAA